MRLPIQYPSSRRDSTPNTMGIVQEPKESENSFVHEGRSKVGGVPLDAEKAKQLILTTQQIIEKFKGRLPSELNWPTFDFEIKVESQGRFI